MPRWVRWLWITLAMLGGLYLAWRLLEVVLVVAVALLITAALLPAVRWLDARRVPHPLSVVLCLLVLVGAFAGVLAYMVPVLVQQASQFTQGLPELGPRLAWLQAHWAGWREEFPFIPHFGDILRYVVDRITASLQALIGFTGRFLAFMVGVVTVLFLVFFFLKDGRRLLDEALSLMPLKSRPETRVVVERVGVRTGHYVLGQLVVMAIDGLLVAIGLTLLGVPYAALLGVLLGLLEIVPFLGPVLAAIPGILLGLSLSWTTGLLTALLYWGVHVLENYLIYPYVTGRFVMLHPVWIVLALLAGGVLLGVIGMVLAVPAAVTIAILIEELVRPRQNGAQAENID